MSSSFVRLVSRISEEVDKWHFVTALVALDDNDRVILVSEAFTTPAVINRAWSERNLAARITLINTR